ncbi:hypothetical protein A2774_02425 [Candidatus Roizmanbacteria bacterium RIFCSPHIGHO2_01_FULL_39_12c]|uniref:Uncharacterized protein n=1 Tax=Candidatus Roizmanbacteria bacterium RIFCSPHIGHO2_01_FULL_39_12c TaxID=1802031 RepID=A0A1F7G8N5_9BACT|nr:MAG: hypothetical protein A2774_02425 [Candidatus Roizmanbacteria bacterium RIFCSPHIGHO2_01_FULL_39_12c]OGK47727.1 MAG: hypothetical protein A2963_00535 [Candidatus Roizmanbacteria bacterium RIFCSPLOWO2_01_FULL_40_13]
MEKDVAKYLRQHTMLVTVLIVIAFLLLSFGEYFLYRKTRELNRMISEGIMQIKEEVKVRGYPRDDMDNQDELMMEEQTLDD